MTRVQVKPELLRWAIERARRDGVDAYAKFPKLPQWESGALQPTWKQVEEFADATHVAVGFLFGSEPPDEPLPFADFRAYTPGTEPSGNLLDTIYAEQRRQDWYREYATVEALDEVSWIGSANVSHSPAAVASKLRALLNFEPEQRKDSRHWSDTPRALRARLEALGVLVTSSGIVGTNTHRVLDTSEFRGFCIADSRAPLIFVNGADHKASQSFTICHELAHLALGQTGLSDEDAGQFAHEQREQWCDDVATEILVPAVCVERPLRDELVREHATDLSSRLKVSVPVALRGVSRKTRMDEAVFRRLYAQAWSELPAKRSSGGGDFYTVALSRVSKRFAQGVVWSAQGGTTSYTEAFRLLGVRNGRGFDEIVQRLDGAP